MSDRPILRQPAFAPTGNRMPDDSEKAAKLDGGLLTVSADAVTLLSGSFEWDEE